MKVITAKRKTTSKDKVVINENSVIYSTESWICLFGVALVRKNIHVMIIGKIKSK